MQCLRCPGKGFLGLYSGGGITLKGSRHMERANSMGDASKWQWRREGNLTERFCGERNSRKSCKETQLCQHGEEGEDSEKGITWGFTIGKYSMLSHLSFEHLLMVCYPRSLHVLRGSLMLSCVPLLQAVLLAPRSWSAFQSYRLLLAPLTAATNRFLCPCPPCCASPDGSFLHDLSLPWESLGPLVLLQSQSLHQHREYFATTIMREKEAKNNTLHFK